MANFSPFKFTTKGLDLEYEVQAGKVLNFSKFVLGDGYYTGSIRDLTSLVNFVREEPITRMEITGIGNRKRIRIGFDLDTTKITNGFYLREIGIIAIDPDTQEEVLMFYTNAGETADYITNDTSSTITTKLINAEIYVTDVAEITATIDDSLVYALKSDFDSFKTEVTEIITAIEDNLPSKTSDLEKDDVYTKQQVDELLEDVDIDVAEVAKTGDYNDLINQPMKNAHNVLLVDGQNTTLASGIYHIDLLYVNNTLDDKFTNSICVVYTASNGWTYISVLSSNNMLQQGYNFYNVGYDGNTWVVASQSLPNITYGTNDLQAGVSTLPTGDIHLVYK